MASLQAKFDRFTLHNLLRYLANASATGRLTIQSNNGHETQVFLERGKVVHHDMPEAGVAGMTELLSWQKGTFYFEDGTSAPKKTLRLFLDNVLPDEQAPSSNNAEVSTLGVILRPSTVLSAEGSMDLATGTIALDVFAIELLMHFDGQRTLRDVAEVVGKPLEQVISSSRLLLAKGIAHPLDDATPKPHQHAPASSQTSSQTDQQAAPAASQPTTPRQPRERRERPAPPTQQARPASPANNQATSEQAANQAANNDDLADFARDLTRGSSTSSQSQASNYVNPAFLDDFTQLAQEKLGPVASMLVEDVLLDVGASPTTLTATHIEQLVDEVEANITRQDWQEDFRSSVDALRANYGV